MLTIGKVAAQTDLSTNALRLYEREGLTQLETTIRSMKAISGALDLLIADCPEQGRPVADCPILGAMEQVCERSKA